MLIERRRISSTILLTLKQKKDMAKQCHQQVEILELYTNQKIKKETNARLKYLVLHLYLNLKRLILNSRLPNKQIIRTL
jgi:hypothetical protein